MPRTRPTLRVGRGLVEEVRVGIFDAVVVGDWKAVGVWVVDGGGAGDHGFGRVRGLSRTICGRGDDGDELAEEVAFGAQVGGPLGGTAVFVIFAGIDDAGADSTE